MDKLCFHCGDPIIGRSIAYNEKEFCCTGCRSVYQLLSENNLGDFYAYEQGAGTRPKEATQQKYAFLDVPDLRQRYILYEDEQTCHVTLFLPSIHCSSCIYLLENLDRLEPAIQSVQVNFSKREASISFDSSKLAFSALAGLLDSIGYVPNFGNRKETTKKVNKTYLYKLGVAGFAFGSIMLWSFPEYLGIEHDNPEFRGFTSYLSLLVSIPVLLYSANEYLLSAWKAVQHRSINLDVPITLGILALYGQSLYSILAGLGPGYMDSFAMFVFFLLIGKWFQSKTYQSLAFDRDYSSYFPVAVTRKTIDGEEIVAIEQLRIGEIIRLKNEEILPCDAILKSTAIVDYSFVTGEADLVEKNPGDFVYAGAKLIGKSAEFKIEKEANRSQLTELWNREYSKDSNVGRPDRFSVFFLVGVLIVSAVAGVLWMLWDASRAVEVVVSVLIVACPCALALSRPFTYGNIMRLLGRQGLYLKNAQVIDRMQHITDIVFDKTGTLTTSKHELTFEGDVLSEKELQLVLAVVGNSSHPYARAIAEHVGAMVDAAFQVDSFEEVKGKGMKATIQGHALVIGSLSFVEGAGPEIPRTGSWLKIDGIVKGKFCFHSQLRPDVALMLSKLHDKQLHVLSGDGPNDLKLLQSVFPETTHMRFQQTPTDKLLYIEALQREGKFIMMLGDGLNDVGALKEATCGVSISEDIFQFTPSSDAIVDASKLAYLPRFLAISRFATTILRVCLVFSLMYNTIGLGFAISGQLTPLVAAILMPISSITVVFLATFGTLFFYPKK